MTYHKGTKGTKTFAHLLSRQIIGAAIDVHRALGPGLLESAYDRCLTMELADRGLFVERQVIVPVIYKGRELDCGYRLDLLVEGTVIIELKTVERLLPIHHAQLLTYLRLTQLWLGLLLNFNVDVLVRGVRRIANG